MGSMEMVPYGINKGKQRIGRIDVTYRESVTGVIVSGVSCDDISQKLIDEMGFDWKELSRF
jgi:hypothetical protein